MKDTKRRFLRSNSHVVYILGIGLFCLGIIWLVQKNRSLFTQTLSSVSYYRETTLKSHKPDISPTRMVYPTPTAPVQLTPTHVPIQATPQDTLPWGVASKVDDVTYSIKVGYDDTMATPMQVLEALNVYRQSKGVSSLSWNDRLGSYAQSRADFFTSSGTTDKHAGFNTYLNEQNGFQQLRFNKVGENSYFGGPLTGTHVIEWVFSQSPGHDANQLNPQWTHVGVGTSKDAINLIFGAGEF